MSTPKHTPGPLSLGHQQRYDTGRDILSNGRRVGICYGDTDTECIANGMMFAAAPELAECLQAMVAECSQWPGGSVSGETIERAAKLLERLGG